MKIFACDHPFPIPKLTPLALFYFAGVHPPPQKTTNYIAQDSTKNLRNEIIFYLIVILDFPSLILWFMLQIIESTNITLVIP